MPSPIILSKPSNIYSSYNAETEQKIEMQVENVLPENVFELSIKETPVALTYEAESVEEEIKFEVNTKEQYIAETPVASIVIDDLSEEEEQRRRALERIQKLRNLSFNMNTADSNTEFDNVPAYVRRNMELFGNTLTTVENFYGRATVEKNDKDETFISTKNSFLDGQRPD
jgi:cell division protein FtsZ